MEEHQSQAPTMWTISLKEKFCKSLSWTSPLHAMAPTAPSSFLEFILIPLVQLWASLVSQETNHYL